MPAADADDVGCVQRLAVRESAGDLVAVPHQLEQHLLVAVEFVQGNEYDAGCAAVEKTPKAVAA